MRLFRWFVPLFAVTVTLGIAALPAAAAGAGAASSQCAYADALAHDGERQPANAAYLKVLATDPSSACANAGVIATQPPSTSTLWTTIGNVIMDATHAAGVVLLGVLVIGIAALLWLQLQTRAPGLKELWPARRIRRPVFTVEPLTDTETDKLGSAVAGLIRGRVTWRTDRFGLNLVSGQAGIASAFSGLADVSNDAKAAVAVITFLTALLPRRQFRLSGQLQPAGDEGVGISLELSQNGNAEALQSLWAESFHLTGTDTTNATAYQQLAVASAAWVDIWMTKTLDPGALLTGDPQSWAFFRSGVEAQRLGDAVRAKSLYEQALAADGTNVGAMANLGIISRRAHEYEDAKDYLTRALNAIKKPDKAPDLSDDENPDWYRISYQFAALYTNWAVDSEPGERNALAARAAGVARELAINTIETLTRLEKGGRRQGKAPKAYLRDTLLPFLEGTIEPSVLTLLAGTVSPLPVPPADWRDKRPQRADIGASLSRNEINPWQLIAYVELGPNRPAATQFNLACFYTRAGDLSTAATRLIRAVRETQRQERKSLVAVATTDPVLRPLMQMRPGIKAKLHKVLDNGEPFDDLDDLLRHFDRQDRAMSHYESQGFMVGWGLNTRGADLTASKKSERLLIRLLGHDPNGDTLDAVVGMAARFQTAHPGVDVRVSVVVPDDEHTTVDLDEARDRGIEVLKDTGRGFKCLSDGAPLAPAGVA